MIVPQSLRLYRYVPFEMKLYRTDEAGLWFGGFDWI